MCVWIYSSAGTQGSARGVLVNVVLGVLLSVWLQPVGQRSRLILSSS